VNNLYQGMTLDAVTGLYYERYRDYSPTLGRWMEQDPAQYINGANTYQFVESNPVDRVDPTGQSWWAWLFPPGTSWGYMGMGGTTRPQPPSRAELKCKACAKLHRQFHDDMANGATVKCCGLAQSGGGFFDSIFEFDSCQYIRN
jgi:RHS repeat-associated protein